MSKYESNDYPFSLPAEHIKALNVGPVPQRIFDGMSKYNDTARGEHITPSSGENNVLCKPTGTGFAVSGFEVSGKNTRDSVIVTHRPKDAQVAQLYRIPSDIGSTDMERLSFFDIGSGRTIRSFMPILGEDWRVTWRAGGALMVMDLTGNENFQLWYETQAPYSTVLSRILGDLYY